MPFMAYHGIAPSYPWIFLVTASVSSNLRLTCSPSAIIVVVGNMGVANGSRQPPRGSIIFCSELLRGYTVYGQNHIVPLQVQRISEKTIINGPLSLVIDEFQWSY